jgi:hypothetical protein
METTRPLVVAAANGERAAAGSLLSVSSDDVLIETVKPSANGAGLIVALFGISGRDTSVKLAWHGVKPAATWITDLTEKPLQRAEKKIEVPGYGVVFIRADLEM